MEFKELFLTNVIFDNLTLYVLSSLCIIIMLLVGFFILTNSNLKRHPYRLYGVEILVQTGYLCGLNFSQIVLFYPEIMIVLSDPYHTIRYIKDPDAFFKIHGEMDIAT